MKVFSTLMLQSNENKSCMRVDWISQRLTRARVATLINFHTCLTEALGIGLFFSRFYDNYGNTATNSHPEWLNNTTESMLHLYRSKHHISIT
jgi:hypothetical protein